MRFIMELCPGLIFGKPNASTDANITLTRELSGRKDTNSFHITNLVKVGVGGSNGGKFPSQDESEKGHEDITAELITNRVGGE